MEGWRQRRIGSKEDHSTSKGNHKTDLTLTGLLMEGVGTNMGVDSLFHGFSYNFKKTLDIIFVACELRQPRSLK